MQRITSYILFICLSSAVAHAQVTSFSKNNVKSLVLRLEKQAEDPAVTRVQLIDRATGKKKLLELKQVRSGKWWGGTYSLHSGEGDGKNVDFSFQNPTTQTPYQMLPVNVGGKQVLIMFQTSEAAEQFAKRHLKNGQITDVLQAPAALSDQDRVQAELKEAEKRAMALAEQERLSAEQRAQKGRQALALLDKADQLYRKEQYEDALESYEKAIQFDPSLDAAYYKYGVSLYKTDQFEKSLTMLGMSETGAENPLEKEYFVALNYVKLKKMDEAVEKLHDIKDENDPVLSSLSAYLAGDILFQQEKYSEAKSNFEYVLDNSQNPELDKAAEAKVEEIDRIVSFQASQKEFLRYSLFAGLSYDQNILNQIQQGQPTDNAGYRLSYGTSLIGYFYRTYKTEFTGQLAFLDMYSMDTKFKGNRTLQSADPQVLAISLPFRTQFALGQKAFSWSLSPSTTSVTMDPDQTTRRRIIQSNTVDTELSFPYAGLWISSLRGQYNQDTSYIEVTDEDENLSGTRTTFGTTQTRILDPRTGKTLGVDLSFAKNAAKGKNNNNDKMTVGLLYQFPISFWAMQSNAKLEYMTLKYPNNSNQRSDSATSASLGLAKSFKNGISLSASYQYTANTSNVENYRYNKSLISTMFSYSGAFSRK